METSVMLNGSPTIDSFVLSCALCVLYMVCVVHVMLCNPPILSIKSLNQSINPDDRLWVVKQNGGSRIIWGIKHSLLLP